MSQPQDQENLTAKRLETATDLAIRSQPDLFAYHRSGGLFARYRWIRKLAPVVRHTVLTGGRLVLNMPPRHGKSWWLSRWLVIWFLEHWPMRNVINVSYDRELARSNGRYVRNQFDQNPLLATRLGADSTSAGRWNTAEGGGMYCTSTNGAVGGWGFHLGVLDDPIKDWREAQSYTFQQRLAQWFGAMFMERAEPRASLIISGHRFSEMDIFGMIQEQAGGKWVVISLPAIAEDDDPIGRLPGEALCPERFDIPEIENIRSAPGMTDAIFQTIYQQAPERAITEKVYCMFDHHRNIDDSIDLRDDLPLQIAVDFNINPGMHLIVGQYDGDLDVFTAVYELHGPRWDVRKVMHEFRVLVESMGDFVWRELHIFGDATGKRDWEGTSESCYSILFDELKLWCPVSMRRRVPNGNPPVADRVQAMNSALCDAAGEFHYKIHPRCTRLLVDLKTMKPDADGLLDKRTKELSHASDAEGYRIHYLRPMAKLDRPKGRIFA